MIITTSWDDGDALDERLGELLARHRLRGTFYLTRHYRSRQLSPAAIRALAVNHEIGSHTLSHPDLTRLSTGAKKAEIAGGKTWLEDTIGEAVAMFCYPFGRFDAEAKRTVAAAGFRGARTTRQFVVAPGVDPFALATSLQVYPTPLRRETAGDYGRYVIRQRFRRGSRYAALQITAAMLHGWPDLAETMARAAGRDETSIFHLWGHSWEIDATGMWRQLEAFLASLERLGCTSRANGELAEPAVALAAAQETP